MAPVRSYTNWNSRTTDEEEQIEPYRKYFFICEGANTETWYFKKLIDIRKELNIHPLIDIRLLEKTEGDRDISFPRRLIEFAENQKENPEIAFDKERDKMIVVFDGDIFEEKVLDYDELVAEGEKKNILAVSNPAFELFLLLHYENSYEDDIEMCIRDRLYTKDNLPEKATRTWVTKTVVEKDNNGNIHYVTKLADAYKVSGEMCIRDRVKSGRMKRFCDFSLPAF